MKRILAFLLAFILLFTLAACEKKDHPKNLGSRYEDREDDDDDEKEQTPVFETITVFDEPEYLVQVLDVTGNNMQLHFENRSAEASYTFQDSLSAVNGLITDVSLYKTLAPGEKSTANVYFTSTEEKITHLHLTIKVFSVYTQVDENAIDYYPYGEEAATVYERAPKETDESIYTQDGFSLLATEYSLNREHFTILLYLSNTGDETIRANFTNWTIDGFTFNFSQNYTEIVLPANTRMPLQLFVQTTDLQNCGIRKLDKVLCNMELTQGDGEVQVQAITFALKDLFVPKVEVDFSPIVVLDKENYFLQITNMTVDTSGSVTLTLLSENRSETTAYTFQLTDLYTNSLKGTNYFTAKLNPGEKIIKTLTVTVPSEEDFGDITHIQALFTVTESESYSTIETAAIDLYPQGNESTATAYRRKIKVTDHVILDNEYLTLLVTEYKSTSDGELQMQLYYYNKGDTPLYINWENLKINDTSKSTYNEVTLMGNCACFSYEFVYDNFLLENHITQIDSITLDLQLLESDSYNAKVYFTENIQLMNEPFAVNLETE